MLIARLRDSERWSAQTCAQLRAHLCAKSSVDPIACVRVSNAGSLAVAPAQLRE
jgi:hypothetical protein